MAQIPQLVAKRGLDPDRIPDTRVRSFTGEALGSLGAALEDVGATLTQRQQQRENFKVENDYRKFQLDLSAGMEDYSANNMPEGGIGYHDGFLKDVYQPKRDAFLKNVPERLRSKFETTLADGTGADFGEWSNRAATRERDANYVWSRDQIKTTSDGLANAISLNPEQYDTVLKSGYELIDSSTLPAAEKAELRKSWETMAQVSHLNRMLEDDPENVLKALGANPNKLAPTTQFSILASAVQSQETGSSPNQISPAGAIGSHQVMPGTARDIAKAMGDEAFPFKGSPSEVSDYLLRPGMSKQYGEFYLKQLMRKYPGDLEAVLIAYHSGPGNADKWLEAGRSDDVLGPVGKKYYKEVIARLPGGYSQSGGPTGGVPRAGSAGSVRMLWIRDGGSVEMGPGNKQFDKLQPDLVDRLRAGFAAAGMDSIRIRSGFRDPAHNAKVGGASKSQHLGGSAVDIDVSGMSQAQRVQLIQNLSAAGITGLGIGANSLHADIGGRRAWGYFGNGASGAPIPKWAKAAIDQHLAGAAKPTMSMGGDRYASLPYDKRQQFISNADNALTQRTTAAAKASAADKVTVRQGWDNELALIRSTGQGSGTFDETRIATVLGEDDYLKWVAKKQEAQRMFTALDGMKGMDPSELQSRIEDYEPNPKASDFDSQQSIHQAVVKEADRVTRTRASNPDKAALEFPEVKAAYDKVATAQEPAPADVQAFVKAMLQKQKEFGVKADALAPIPSAWAFQIGQSLTRVPERSKEVKLADVRAAVAVQYDALYKMFGDYTDEVIVYALSEYKGLSETNAEIITSMMKSIAVGGDPFKRRGVDPADMDQVESMSSTPFGYRVGEPAAGGTTAFGYRIPQDPAAQELLDPDAAEAPVPSRETILRVIGRLNSLDTPEEEADLVEEYGQRAVDAAKLQISGGRQ